MSSVSVFLLSLTNGVHGLCLPHVRLIQKAHSKLGIYGLLRPPPSGPLLHLFSGFLVSLSIYGVVCMCVYRAGVVTKDEDMKSRFPLF